MLRKLDGAYRGESKDQTKGLRVPALSELLPCRTLTLVRMPRAQEFRR